MNERIRIGLPRMECLFQGIQSKDCLHISADLPADDAASVDVNDESNIQPALPGEHIGEVGHPTLIRTISLEMPVDAGGT
jgi:hypothetical protein